MIINDLFHNYRDLLNKSWGVIEKVENVIDWGEDIDLATDWMQASLELLVVRAAVGPDAYLKSQYGEGRMISPELPATHELIVTEKSDQNSRYIFRGLCTCISGGCKKRHPHWPESFWEEAKKHPECPSWGIYPPFDYVTLFRVGDRYRKLVDFHVDEVDFFLQELSAEQE